MNLLFTNRYQFRMSCHVDFLSLRNTLCLKCLIGIMVNSLNSIKKSMSFHVQSRVLLIYLQFTIPFSPFSSSPCFYVQKSMMQLNFFFILVSLFFLLLVFCGKFMKMQIVFFLCHGFSCWL